MSGDRTAVISDANSGIGHAVAIALAAQGFHLHAGARPLQRLQHVPHRRT